MIKFRTPFSEERYRPYSEPGSPMHTEYDSYFDLDGNLVLKETGETNIYLNIQSYAKSADINTLVARFRNGDESALNQVHGYYVDITKIPDLHETYNLIRQAQEDFLALPVEIKEKFDNSFEKYLFNFDSEDFRKTMKIPEEENIKESEIKDAE